MGIRVGIEHRTTYRFDKAVTIHPHVVRLRPAPHCRTPIEAYSLRVDGGADHFLNWQQDPFGNYLARLVFPEPADHLDITVDLVADMQVINPFDFFVEDSASTYPFDYAPELAVDLQPYLTPLTDDGPLLTRWLASLDFLRGIEDAPPGKGHKIVDFMVDINRALFERVGYTIRMEPGVQAPEATLARAVGSCRDSGWLLVEALRRLGLAARFVSGYLVQLTPDPLPGLDTSAIDGPTGPEADFTDLHAWAEVYIPGAGWVGLDPTSGLLAGEGHIPLACTPRPASAAPVAGATDKAEVEFDYSNRVLRLREEPRVTLPYSDAEWARIDQLGQAVDKRLVDHDVRLTMGGEPTFVSVDDMEGDEWNTAADGQAKRRLALELANRLRDRFGPGGLIQHGQGKWYPGEPLPRWQIGALWRNDGKPVWNRPELLAGPAPGKATIADARRLIETVASRFSLDSSNVVAAYEDPVFELRAEYRLPAGPVPRELAEPVRQRLDPEALAAWERLRDRDRHRDHTDDQSGGDDAGRPPGTASPGTASPGTTSPLAASPLTEPEPPDFHAELLARLSGDPGTPAGYALPLHPGEGNGPWVSTEWNLRRGALFLQPGDSPIGLRLPLASLTWSEHPPSFARSPFEPRSSLPTFDGQPEPARMVERHQTPPTALTVEVDDGHVKVFMPPMERVEEALELVAVLDATAAELDLPVVIEGYPLPVDHRVSRLVVTPDPGVIEVNVHPSGSWDDLRDVVEALYAEARLTRLGTEKFDLDGTHTGTGGGNHVTLGGATPDDSPMLRRPDLLASMVTFWQHHPSLSYLFSGRFIGPTSQSPRADEGRSDNLYELELALDELHRAGGPNGAPAQPWIVDRLLRNLLVDLTGNTHRAEFSIDKLFSPDSERGRLGLVEMRAFEMPPHPRMALVQALLVRSLLVRFWERPYRGPLVRWGPELHDRFLLPWYARLDANEVVDDLAEHGIAFDRSWLDPFFEFRFPLIGSVERDDVRVELRSAIEPWHVLGEEATGSGTARYVDSAVERLQVMVDGFNPQRHAVTCNGVPVPLQPTSTPGVAVAGVRYKAWAPHSSLHPTIGAHGPLVFDVIDRWNGRSIGGCTYHITHPGGLAYDAFPVNAAEAETRRMSRFSTVGHTPGPVDVDRLNAKMSTMFASDNRRTVDLRRHPEADSRVR
jgi:uncharacterized protein (DUF2126 family)